MTEEIEGKEVTTQTQSISDEAQNIVVSDRDSYLRAGELILAIKALRKRIAAAFKPIKQRIDEAKREVLNQERAADLPLMEAENILAPQIIAYEKAQELLRRTEEMRLQTEARKSDVERRLREAIFAEASGEEALALSILEEAACTTPVLLPRSLPKISGMTLRKNWSFRITNPDLIPREYLTPDLVKIGGVVRALKNQCRIPGIAVYEEETIQGRRPTPPFTPGVPFFGS